MEPLAYCSTATPDRVTLPASVSGAADSTCTLARYVGPPKTPIVPAPAHCPAVSTVSAVSALEPTVTDPVSVSVPPTVTADPPCK